jgi:hypothetical protein
MHYVVILHILYRVGIIQNLTVVQQAQAFACATAMLLQGGCNLLFDVKNRCGLVGKETKRLIAALDAKVSRDLE